MGIITVLWEKWVEFRRDFYKITMAAMISPLMYLLIFGFGIQTTSHGEPYLMFLIPGIVAMSTMTGSFGAVAQNMSVQRLYEKALDQVMVSPTQLWQFITGQILGGALRGMYAGIVILLLTLPVQNGLIFNGWSFLIMFLNGMVFSTIALVLSFLSKSYAVQCLHHYAHVLPLQHLLLHGSDARRLPQNRRCPAPVSGQRYDSGDLPRRRSGNHGGYCSSLIPCGFLTDCNDIHIPKEDTVKAAEKTQKGYERLFSPVNRPGRYALKDAI